VCGEVLAVVELDAFSEMEAPSRRLQDLPSLGEPRNDLQVLVPLGKPLHDVAEGTKRESLVQRIRIEGVEVALEGVAECLRVRGCGKRGGGDDGGRCQET